MKKKSSRKKQPGATKRAYKKRATNEAPEKATRSKGKVADDEDPAGIRIDKASLDFQIKHYNNSKAMNYDLLIMYRPRLDSPQYVTKLGKYFAENGLTFKSISVGGGMINKKMRLVALFDDKSTHTEKDRVPISDGPRYQFIRDRGLAEKIITAVGVKLPTKGAVGIKVYCDILPAIGNKGDKMFEISLYFTYLSFNICPVFSTIYQSQNS